MMMTVNTHPGHTFTLTKEQSGEDITLYVDDHKLGKLKKINEPIRLGGCFDVIYMIDGSLIPRFYYSLTPIVNISVSV